MTTNRLNLIAAAYTSLLDLAKADPEARALLTSALVEEELHHKTRHDAALSISRTWADCYTGARSEPLSLLATMTPGQRSAAAAAALMESIELPEAAVGRVLERIASAVIRREPCKVIQFPACR